jgi:hypothetical protein
LTLLFKKKYVSMILNGAKTATRRTSRPMVKPGGVYNLRTDFFTYSPHLIQVERLYEQKLGDVTLKDAKKEGYLDPEEFREDWVKLYKDWTSDRYVWVVEFSYLGSIRAFI